MSRKKQRQKKATTRPASAVPTVARMSRAPSAPGRASTWPSAAAPAASPQHAATSHSSAPPPRRSISPWANPGSASLPAKSAVAHAPVSEVVAVPRQAALPTEARVLPEPPVVRAPVAAASERQTPHHWSDPPPRPEPAVSPVQAPAAAVQYFTVPAGTQATPAAAPAFTTQMVASESIQPALRTPSHGVATDRRSDPGARDHAEFADHAQFFASQPPKGQISETLWDDHDEIPGVMHHGSKRAMQTTFWILGVSVAVIGAFVIYNQVVMPAPAPLTGVSALSLPTPVAPAETPRAAQVPPPPVAQPQQPVAPVAQPPIAQATGVDAPTVDPALEPEPPENEPDIEPDAPENEPELAVAALPENSPAMTSYRELLDQAGTFYRQRKHQRALEAYELAIAVNPNGDEALGKVAYHYLNVGKNNEARDYAQRAVAANPKSSEGWIVLGAAREALRDREGAMEAYRQCATIGEGSFVSECKRLAR